MRLKKQKRVAAVFTRRGDVFFKPVDGESSDVGEINSSRDAALENNSFRNSNILYLHIRISK